MSTSLRKSLRQSLCPLPLGALGERAARSFTEDERVRGTSHPTESVEMSVMPSPPRGQGTATPIAMRGGTALA